MNITFLVGNGFDISTGLNTSYKDFYNWYCNRENSLEGKNGEAIRKLKESIKDNEYWSDLELGLGHFTSECELSEEGTSDVFVACYDDVHNHISEFIKLTEGKYKKDLITDNALNDFRMSIRNFYTGLKPRDNKDLQNLLIKLARRRESIKIKFISYNYTRVLDWFVEAATEKGPLPETPNHYPTATINPEVLHIHGTADHFPILGVCEEKYIDNQDLLQDERIRDSLLKPNSVDYIQEFWYEDAKKLIKNSDIICIFGMSLGESDSTWWEEIMSWMNFSSNRHLIVFWYTSGPQNNISIPAMHSDIDPIVDTLMAYNNGSPEVKDRCRSQIHVVFDTERMLVVPTCSENVVK